MENSDRGSSDFYAQEKRSIGKLAATLLKSGQSIVFDNSTTAMECARQLDPAAHFTFYSTNNETTQILLKHSNSVLYCSGGYYWPESRGFIGPQAENFVASIQADVCLIGASGISVEHGITSPYPMHTVLERNIIRAAKTRILCADHSKFGKVAIEKAADLSDIDVIVTDANISENILKEYGKYVKIITPKGDQ